MSVTLEDQDPLNNQRAMMLHDRAMEVTKKCCGEAHADFAISLSLVSVTLARQGLHQVGLLDVCAGEVVDVVRRTDFRRTSPSQCIHGETQDARNRCLQTGNATDRLSRRFDEDFRASHRVS